MTRSRATLGPTTLMFLMSGLSISACGPDPNRKSGDPSGLPTNEQTFGSTGTKCNAYRPPTEPDLIGWDSGSRGKLNNQRSYGVIVVRYVAKGCNVELEVLSNCIARTQQYTYHPYWSNESKVASNQEELFANLPIGAASLQGYIKDGESLRADLTSAGIVSIPPDATFSMADLKGADCGRATHVVTKVYVGAFAMAAGAAQTLRAQASVFGIGSGAGKSAAHSIGREEGDLTACKTAKADQKEHADCAVPLRITLLGVEGAVGGSGSESGDKAVMSTTPPAKPGAATSTGEWQVDGITLGKAVGGALQRAPYATQLCDDDPAENQTRRVLFYGAKECRGKSFPEGSSVVIFTDSYTGDRANEKVSAIAWVGGTYFNASRTSFPLQVGEPAARAAEVLGPVQATFYLKQLMVQKHARAYSLIDGSKIAGFVIGTMPPEGKESWSAVSQVYTKYTERVDPTAAGAKGGAAPSSVPPAAAAAPPPAAQVTIREQVFFESGKSAVSPASDAVLRAVSDTLNRNPKISVLIEGHTDSQEAGGDPKGALKLSQERAQSVYLSLIKLGVSSNRLTVGGAGSTKPIAVNSTPQGRAQNRRVAFAIWSTTN